MWAAALRPVVDAVAPADPAAPGRRVRLAAIWMAISAWLLPPYAGLGTDTAAHRGAICAAFVVAAVAAHYRHRRRWAEYLLWGAALTAEALIRWFGGQVSWGLGFGLFAFLVVVATEVRNRHVRLAPPPEEPDPLPPEHGRVTRFLTWYAWFGITALLMWRFAGQGMVVPTGSMQPTIMGSAGQRPSFANLGSPGDHLFVDGFSYLFRDPRRWEIVVFEYPLMRERNFVKRVVGLPGEHVEIRDGDIWADGKIARKPRVVQQTMWRELFPRPNFLSKPKAINDGFQQDVGTGGTWSRVSETEMRCVPGKDASFAFFNWREPFADLRVAFTAVPDDGGVVLARITSRGLPLTLRIEVAGPSSLSIGSVQTPLESVAAAGRTPLRVEFCVADGEAWALVDGREVASAELPVDRRGRNRLELGAVAKSVSFKDVEVARDVVYAAAGGPGVYDVPKDGFFFIGDNVEQSEDSRKWTVEVFHPAGGGPPIRAAASYPDENGNPGGGGIRIVDGTYRFRDVDAVLREIPVAGTTIDKGVPAPFAMRRHLLGRAVLVFWPWAPAEAGFRPRLIP
jgi:signal peptidase I